MTTDDAGLTVVLGWDGLDPDLIEQFGLADAFGTYWRPIETICNPVIEEPHTHELWPTLITGLPPREHGIRSHSPGGGADWDARWLDWLSDAAHGVVPASVRSWAGRRLRDRGAELAFRGPEYYATRGIETVFDGRRSRPIAVPNYRVEQDDYLDVVVDRGAQLKQVLDIERVDGETIHRPTVPQATHEERLHATCGHKLGAVRTTIERDYDLVWVWLGYLDSAGHLDPMLDEPFQERAYRQAAAWTEWIRAALQPDDTLVCVSDHGLQDGHHTERAVLCADRAAVCKGVHQVTDVRTGIERITPAHDGDGSPPVRDVYATTGGSADRSAAAVRSQLADLGYLEGN